MSSESDVEELLKNEMQSDSNTESDNDAASETSDYNFSQQDLDKLASNDPEFHDWLKNQNPDLLKVDTEEPEHEQSDLEESDQEHGENESENSENEEQNEQAAELNSQNIKVTEDLLSKLILSLNDPKIQNFKTLTCLVVGAVDYISNDDEILKKFSKNKNEIGIRDFMYRKMGKFAVDYEISEADEFNSILMIGLRHVTSCLGTILVESKDGKFQNFRKIKTSLKVYVECLINLLKILVDRNSKILIVRNVYSICKYISQLPKMSKKLINVLITLWGHYPKNAKSVKDSESDSNKLRILAYLCINRLSNGDIKLSKYATKEMYSKYNVQIKTTSVHTLPVIDFMKRTLSEMFLNKNLIASNQSYKCSFLFIRNLALNLRKAITTQKSEAVISWTFVHALNLWVNVISNTTNEQIEKLTFPLVQIIIGALKLEPSCKNIPFRIHLSKLLIQIMQTKGIFIPMHVYLWPIISLVDKTVDDSLEHATKRSIVLKAKNKYFNEPIQTHTMNNMFPCMLKFSASQMSQSINLGSVLSGKFIDLYLKFLKTPVILNSLGFTELFHPIIKILTKYIKTTKCEHYKNDVKKLKQLIINQSNFISNLRESLNFNVKNVDQSNIWNLDEKYKGKSPIELYKNDAKGIKEDSGDRSGDESESEMEEKVVEKRINKNKLKRKIVENVDSKKSKQDKIFSLNFDKFFE